MIAQLDNPVAVAYEIAVILEELGPEQPPETPAGEDESGDGQESGDPSSSTESGDDGQENGDPSGSTDSGDDGSSGCGTKAPDGDPTLCMS